MNEGPRRPVRREVLDRAVVREERVQRPWGEAGGALGLVSVRKAGWGWGQSGVTGLC